MLGRTYNTSNETKGILVNILGHKFNHINESSHAQDFETPELKGNLLAFAKEENWV